MSYSGGGDATPMLNNRTGHPNPMFDYLSGFMPRKLKDLFRWCEYLYFNNSNIYIGLAKFANYIITDLVYKTDSAGLRAQYKRLYEGPLGLKSFLKSCQTDKGIYGNALVSVHLRIRRMWTCPNCQHSAALAAKNLTWKYDATKMLFHVTCPSCSKVASNFPLADMQDEPIRSADGIRLIRWDMKRVDIEHNDITGETRYWYNFPTSTVSKVKEGERLFVAQMPREVLECVATEKPFLFEDGSVFHLKYPAPAGVDNAMGMPRLTSTLKKHYYASVLRKANEAIAMDFIVPFRIVHPQQAQGTIDPLRMMQMAQWVRLMQSNFKKQRQDPLHLMFSPFPVGVSQVGGQGRALMTLGEVQAAEEDIIASIGFPKEFIYGGLSYTGSSVSLRMLENQLLTEKYELVEMLNWMTARIAQMLGWEATKMDLVPFKFVDDVQAKQLELNANGQYNYLSSTPIAEMFGRDIDQLRKQRIADAVEDARTDLEIQKRVTDLNTSLADQARQMSQSQLGAGLNYDQQAVIAGADSIVQQLMELPYEQRRSFLDQLQSEDYVMYAVALKRFEQIAAQSGGVGEAQAAQQTA